MGLCCPPQQQVAEALPHHRATYAAWCWTCSASRVWMALVRRRLLMWCKTMCCDDPLVSKCNCVASPIGFETHCEPVRCVPRVRCELHAKRLSTDPLLPSPVLLYLTQVVPGAVSSTSVHHNVQDAVRAATRLARRRASEAQGRSNSTSSERAVSGSAGAGAGAGAGGAGAAAGASVGSGVVGESGSVNHTRQHGGSMRDAEVGRARIQSAS